MTRNIKVKLQKVAITATALLLGLLLAGTKIAWENALQISGALGQPMSKVVTLGDSDDDLEYWKTGFDSIVELQEKASIKAEEVMGEGVVLLKNDNALPLSMGSKVSLFSMTSVSPVYGGTGSGGVDSSSAPSFKEAFERNSNMEINRVLFEYYESKNYTGSDYVRRAGQFVDDQGDIMPGTSGVLYNGDVPWNVLTGVTGFENSIVEYGDAAIFVLGRVGGEGGDLRMTNFSTEEDATDGDYLRLTPKEASVLEGLKAKKDSGVIKKIVLLINSSNNLSADFIDDSRYGIDAALWIGTPGTIGLFAVGDILVGKINPSGRLTSMFWNDNKENPVNYNFGVHYYDGTVSGKIDHGPELPSQNIAGTSSATYVVYQEGIYLGYKYTETRYTDYVTNSGNPGNFDYSNTVKYPFGYGLSYTNFEYSDLKVTGPITVAGETKYTVSVKVTNTGDVAGKEVVQIYLKKPYTPGGIEKAAVELVGFGKTPIIEPGAENAYTLNIEVEEKFFTSYDADDERTYILETGNNDEYLLTAAKNAHDAANNFLAKDGHTVTSTNNRMTKNGNASLVSNPITFVSTDQLKYEYSSPNRFTSAVGQRITNLFDYGDINKYDGKGNNSVKYLSRNDWMGTFPTKHVSLTWTDQMARDMSYDMPEDEIPYPKFGENRNEDNLIQLIALRVDENGNKIAYNDPIWDEFMDQIEWDEIVTIMRSGIRNNGAIPSIGKPYFIDHNGPNGLTERYNAGNQNRGYAVRLDDPNKSDRPMLYPGTPVVASTFNLELALEMGEMMGEEALWAGYNGLYGPGSNIFRSPYSGRNFEYYSEDGFLSGMISAYHIKGMQSKGMYVLNKHGILNDQELNRMGISTWANEQSIREIYARAFEIPITHGDAKGIMSGFNRIGVIWNGANYSLNTTLYRHEWGMDGWVVTDMWYGQTDHYMNMVGMVLSGNDWVDGIGQLASLNAYHPQTGTLRSGEVANAVRESAKRVLYTAVHSNGMNGISSNMRIVRVTPGWQKMLITIDVILGVLLVSSISWSVISYIRFKKKH